MVKKEKAASDSAIIGNGLSVFHTETFEKASDEKKDRIFTTAISEFADLGFSAASINTIARKAGVSIGAMYSYFSSKEDLFLAVSQKGVEIFNRVIEEARPQEGGFFDVLERLLDLTIIYARQHPDLCKLYLSVSSEELASLEERLSTDMESSFQSFYTDLLTKAKREGEIREDVDVGVAGFFIDNLIIMLQLSYSLTYYKKRLQSYVGEAGVEDDHALRANLLNLIHKSLS